MIGILVKSLLALLLMQQPATPPLAEIEGQVVRVGIPEALPIVHARIELTDAANKTTAVFSDSTGHFLASGIALGKYKVTAAAEDYVAAEYGQKALSLPGTQLLVIANQKIEPLLFKLVPAANLMGTVRDYDGEPLANALVEVLKPQYGPGSLSGRSVAGARTDDRGEYRLYSLTPGDYFVRATYAKPLAGGPAFIVNPNAAPARAGYIPVYFSNASDIANAGMISLKAGETVDRMDLRLAPAPTVNIRGTITDSRTGKPAQVFLQMQGSSSGRRSAFQSSTDASGKYEFRGVPEGAYVIVALSLVDERPVGSRPVDVADKDLSDIDFTLVPGVALIGRFRVEGDKTLPRLDSTQLSLGSPGSSGQARPAPSGEFTVANLGEGTYRLIVFGLPAGYYVKSARFGGVDALKELLSVGSSVRDSLDIVIADDTGGIKAAVVDAGDKPYATATVVLVPDEKRRNDGANYKTQTSDANGSIAIKGIPPGDYTLFAWDYVDSGAWYNPEFLRLQMPNGVAVKIEPSTEREIRIKVVEHEK
jgi:hypothetical protein